MKIQQINVNVSKVNNTAKSKSTKLNSQPRFKGNYYSAYNSALTQGLRHYNDALAMFRNLVNAAKTEGGLTKGYYYKLLEGDIIRGLKDAKNTSCSDALLKSSYHQSPLITLDSGEISFHHPEDGEYSQGDITFWLTGNNELNLVRPKDYHKFYENGGVKEFYNKISDGGGIYDHVYYNRDGSKSTIKNFFLT